MRRAKLTNSVVEKFKCHPERKNDVLWCGELKGFGMRLSARSGTRTYFLQYRVKGSKHERQITIGRHNDPYRVEQARIKALELKSRMLSGVDPVADLERKELERTERARVDIAQSATLEDVLAHYLEHKRTKHGPLRAATKEDMRRNIEVNLPDWLAQPIATITRDKCLARFVELTKRAKSAANLTFVYLRSICNYAANLYADDEGNFTILASNPVTRMLKIQKLNREKPRTRRIALEHVGRAWLALWRLRANATTAADRTAADLVCLRLLTALRLTESGSLRWSQIDLGGGTITLLNEVSKTHQDMVLPMSSVLHNILEERSRLPRNGVRVREYVFPSPSNSSKLPYMRDPNATMKKLARAAGCFRTDDKTGKVKYELSAHDFRRTFEDVAKAVRIDPDDRRKLLVHLADDVHGAHYDNSPDPEALRPGVEAIAKYITDAANLAEMVENNRNVIAISRAG